MSSSLAYCAVDLQNAATCIEQNALECGACLSPTDKAVEMLPEAIEVQFRTTLAFLPPAQHGFCAESNARVCVYHEKSMDCCCQAETKKFIQCAFNNVYTTKYGVLEACSLDCQSAESGASSSLGKTMSITIACVVIFSGFFGVVYYYYWKRPSNNAEFVAKEGNNQTQQSSVQSDDKTAQTSQQADLEIGQAPTTTMKSSSKAVTTSTVKPMNGKSTKKLGAKKGKGKERQNTYTPPESPLEEDIEAKEKPRKKQSHQQAKHNALRVDATGVVTDLSSHSLEVSSHTEESISSGEYSFGTDLVEGESKKGGNNSKKKKKKSKKKAVLERAAADADKEHTLLQAEREARMLRFDQRVSTRKMLHLQESQKQTEAMLHEAEEEAMAVEDEMKHELEESEAVQRAMEKELRRVEREKRGMAERMAAMEATVLVKQHGSAYGEEDSFAGEDEEYPLTEVDDYDMNFGPPPVGVIDVFESESMAPSAYHDDDDSTVPESWRGSQLPDSRQPLGMTSSHSISRSKRSKSKERGLAGSDQFIYRSKHSAEKQKSRRSRSEERGLMVTGTEGSDYKMVSSSHHSIGKNRKSRSMERRLMGGEDGGYYLASGGDHSSSFAGKRHRHFAYDQDPGSVYSGSRQSGVAPERGVRRAKSAEDTLLAMAGSLDRDIEANRRTGSNRSYVIPNPGNVYSGSRQSGVAPERRVHRANSAENTLLAMGGSLDRNIETNRLSGSHRSYAIPERGVQRPKSGDKRLLGGSLHHSHQREERRSNSVDNGMMFVRSSDHPSSTSGNDSSSHRMMAARRQILERATSDRKMMVSSTMPSMPMRRGLPERGLVRAQSERHHLRETLSAQSRIDP